jgi:hypothetical protein
VSLFGVSVMSGILIISCYNQIADRPGTPNPWPRRVSSRGGRS